MKVLSLQPWKGGKEMGMLLTSLDCIPWTFGIMAQE